MAIKLTKEQAIIMKHNGGVGLITAGAGCGKTTTLLEYIINCILNLGANPDEILVLSFSKAACSEMTERLMRYRMKHGGALLTLNQVKIMTYEAFGYEIIRQHYLDFGFDKTPSVITNTKMMLNRAAKIAKRHGENRKVLMKNVLTSPQGTSTESNNLLVKKVLNLYKQQKQSQNRLDFEDMVRLLMSEEGKMYVKQAARKYRYLLVDELQDTNMLQTKMLIELAKNIETSVMVGDPKQNIYEFRGADAGNWDAIKTALRPKAFTLSKTQRIPAASLPFINAIGEEIYPGGPLVSDLKGLQGKLVHCRSTVEQAQFIAQEIKKLIDQESVRLEEIVCLGRTKRLLSDLFIALKHHDIAAQETYRTPTTHHVQSLRNMLRMAAWLRANSDGEAWDLPEKHHRNLGIWLKRLGLDKDEISRISDRLPQTGWKAVGVRSRIKSGPGETAKESPKYRRILEFRDLIAQAQQSEELEKSVAYLMDALRMVLRRKYQKLNLNLLMRDLTELKIKIRQFSSWNDLSIKKLKLKNTEGGVHLSTINGAKGKEWKYVFVIHCVDGLLPIHYAKTDKAKLAEKRLLYVACTRHEKALYLMNTPGSMVYYDKGRHDKVFENCSSFITPHTRLLQELKASDKLQAL